MKTKHLVGAFLATALIISGCGDDTTAEQPATETPQTQTKLAGQRLTDDSGVEYTLIDNGDGTETARYDDGRAVTFRREEDGSLDFVSGTAGLLAGMAAGYFLFHGFSSPAGTWDSTRNRYTVSEPLRREERNSTGGGYAGTSARPSTSSSGGASTSNPSAASNSSTRPSTSSASSSSGGVNLTKPAAPSSSASSAKTGFGGAGARAGSAVS